MEGNMKAAILYGPRDIRVEEIPIPKINADQVLIKVEKCGICPSDVRRYVGVKKMFKPRMVPGHEFSGTVIEVGDAIKDINIGERVVSDWAIRCGKCYFCRINLPNYCLNLRRFQEESNGAFAQYTISFPSSIYKIPDSVSFEEAALTEPLACCLHAINLSNISLGDKVLVIGDGPNGLILTQLAKITGASKVIVAGLLDERLRVGLQVGADVSINVQKEDIFSRIKELTNGIGVDIVILGIGAPEAIINAFKLVRKGGKITFFAGIYTQSPLVDLNLIHSNSLKLIGSVDFTPREFLQALELIKNKQIQIKPLISHIIPLDKIQEAFEIVEKLKGLKVLIDPWR